MDNSSVIYYCQKCSKQTYFLIEGLCENCWNNKSQENYFLCPECGKTVDSMIEGLCQNCWADQHALKCEHGQIFPESRFNYKCPDCHGEFNTPAYEMISFTGSGNPKCPWCGKEMKGL